MNGLVYLEGLDDLEAGFANRDSEVIPGQRHFAHVFAPETIAGHIADFCADRQT